MRTSVRVAVTLCLGAVAIFAGFHLWQYYMLTPWTRDARIRADVVVISPDVSGWVRELKAYDNQQVKAGDLFYIPAGVPHLPANLSDQPASAVIARTDPNEQESVVLLPHLDALVPA